MEKLRNKIIEKIIQRDKFRTGKNYYTSLRGYHTRKDILDAMFRSIEIKALPKNRRIIILDAGCGPGIVGDYVYKEITKKYNLHPIVIFVDISEAMLEAVPKKFDYIIVKGDVTKLEFPDNFFDIVVMKQVLDYLPKNLQLRALNEIYRVLKQDGQFILSALISPDDNSNTLTNYLYNQREKIIARGLKFKKYIPTKNILMDWLNCINFKGIEFKYVYDIPLSTIDFQKSFGLNKKQLEKLNKIYCDIIKRDKNNYFKGKIFKKFIELTEKGVIIKCWK
jgi:ubiquinone/menaquinone biosynthesis C-methylase UbiE